MEIKVTCIQEADGTRKIITKKWKVMIMPLSQPSKFAVYYDEVGSMFQLLYIVEIHANQVEIIGEMTDSELDILRKVTNKWSGYWSVLKELEELQ